MGDPQDRNVIETEPLGGFDPAVTGDDLIGSSINTGLINPKRSMLRAIWSSCFAEWVRALRLLGARRQGGTISIRRRISAAVPIR
jgi:hypothetical protein